MHFNVDGLVHTLFPEFQAQHFRKILRFYSRASVTAAVIDSSDSPAMQEEIFGPILPSLLRSGSFQATQHIWDLIAARVSKHETARDVFLSG